MYFCVYLTSNLKKKIDILSFMGAKVVVCPTNVEADDPRSYYSVSKKLAEKLLIRGYVNQHDKL